MQGDAAESGIELAEVAERAARAAGAVALEGFRGPLEIRSKGGTDIVTQYDNMAEEAALSIIHAAFPGDRTLGEESGPGASEGGARGSPTARLWAVDPIDGTHNYAAQIPFWCSSVGVADAQGRILAAAVYDALHDELFTATLSGGAFLNGSQMRVSSVEFLEDAFLVTDIGYEATVASRMMALGPYVQPRIKRLRLLGSAVLALCYVAAGRVDGYYHLSLQPWDLAASSLLITEAGGIITGWTGDPISTDQGSAVAASAHLQP
ncbi:MAG: inositol monophosphatase family protein, partial [Chloroflexia bacterium]